jgi:hypothetical protein
MTDYATAAEMETAWDADHEYLNQGTARAMFGHPQSVMSRSGRVGFIMPMKMKKSVIRTIYSIFISNQWGAGHHFC